MTAATLRSVAIVFVTCLTAWGCAATPGPGDPSYPFNLGGSYQGRFMIDGQPFDASMQVRTNTGGRVGGAVRVSMPVEIEGRIQGTIIDDLLRVSVTYRDPSGCEGRIEGIVTIERGGGIIDGPVTVTDCSGPLAGRMSFRKVGRDPS